MPLVQTFHRFQHHAGHRRQSAKQTKPDATADDLPHPAAQPRRGRHVFGQHRKQEAGEHIRHERAHHERRTVHRRQQQVRGATEPDADEAADEHHEIHQTIGKRVESRLHAFHRRERNLRRMLGCGGTGRAHIRARHFGDVDRLCGGIRLITRVWRVCRPLFLRFHHVPLVLGFPRTASFRPSHTATSWPQVPSS